MINLGAGWEDGQDALINQDQITDVLLLLQHPRIAHNDHQQAPKYQKQELILCDFCLKYSRIFQLFNEILNQFSPDGFLIFRCD